MNFNNVHCFFEQSGTFKNSFKSLGYNAFDYDILDDFSETDFVVDLFSEIEKAYNGNSSIFDKISSEDLIFAFFPCIRFSRQILLSFRGQSRNQKNDIINSLERDIVLSNELNLYFSLLCKLCLVCLRHNIKLIIENPYQSDTFLSKYFCLSPSVIISDRRLLGDYFYKPTQFFFINCVPEENFILDSLQLSFFNKTISTCKNKVERSLISSSFADRFIKTYILPPIFAQKLCIENKEENTDN